MWWRNSDLIFDIVKATAAIRSMRLSYITDWKYWSVSIRTWYLQREDPRIKEVWKQSQSKLHMKISVVNWDPQSCFLVWSHLLKKYTAQVLNLDKQIKYSPSMMMIWCMQICTLCKIWWYMVHDDDAWWWTIHDLMHCEWKAWSCTVVVTVIYIP